MKAMLINSYGKDAVFEAAEVETPYAAARRPLFQHSGTSVSPCLGDLGNR